MAASPIRDLLDRLVDLRNLESKFSTGTWGIYDGNEDYYDVADEGCVASYIPKLLADEIERLSAEIARRAGEVE